MDAEYGGFIAVVDLFGALVSERTVSIVQSPGKT
jgi:hypothetical protein